MSAITRISTNTPWEPIAGYSRLVRAGDIVAVSGTTATDERGIVVGAGQMYVQARQAIANISTALERAGLTLANVIRTRMFVTDIARFAEAARAHKEFFGDFPPATSMVEVRRLVNPDMLIEIEADAYVGDTAKAVAPASKSKALPAKKVSGKSVAKKIASKKSKRKR
jgi:enamine deaminase RidA (YjgF/YER057c/UK114 family)